MLLKNKSDENRQLFCKRRKVSLLQKTKKDYFTKLNEKHIIENICLWKAVKFFSSNKLQSSEKMKFPKENNTLITNEEDVAVEINNIFSNAVINLKTPELENFDPLSEN